MTFEEDSAILLDCLLLRMVDGTDSDREEEDDGDSFFF